MPGLTCNACNSEFQTVEEQKLHYSSEWHRYNLKRKVAGVPGVTESLFEARMSALAADSKKLNEDKMQYLCTLCNKEYRSLKAHAQHLKSKSHLSRACQDTNAAASSLTITRPLRDGTRVGASINNSVDERISESDEEGSEEWEVVDPDELTIDETAESLADLNVDDLDEVVWDPSVCFICDFNLDGTMESYVEHLHKVHGFFIPDAEYLKNPKGLLTYVALKVTRDFICLYCNDQRQPFADLEAVRKHMISKSHCKLRFGDGDEYDDADLEEFYDYSSSYTNMDETQLVDTDGNPHNVEVGFGGELIINRKTDAGVSSKALGSREYLRYYKQKPRPSSQRDVALSRALVSRYQDMGLSTVQSKGGFLRMKVLKEMHRSGLESMRTRVGIKNNVIRNLPKNCTY